MKHVFFFLAAVFLLTGNITAQELKETPAVIETPTHGPEMQFESLVVDYGEIAQNSEPLRKFDFTNTGIAPLIISAAKGSCGCTVPSYPKEPIQPGASAEIEVRYDTKRVGNFTKSVTLTTNAVNNTDNKPAGTFLLTIKGKVNPVEVAPGAAPVILPLGGTPE